MLIVINPLHHYIQPTARTDYILRTQVHFYNNPTNQCLGCHFGAAGARVLGCCDSFEVNVQCSGETRCDNEFFSCARPLGTPRETLSSLIDTVSLDRAEALQCIQPLAAIRSTTNTDGASIDFEGPTFLGLANPIGFEIDAN